MVFRINIISKAFRSLMWPKRPLKSIKTQKQKNIFSTSMKKPRKTLESFRTYGFKIYPGEK